MDLRINFCVGCYELEATISKAAIGTLITVIHNWNWFFKFLHTTRCSYRESRKFRPDNSNYLRTVLRSGNHASSVRIISIASVHLFVPGKSNLSYAHVYGNNYSMISTKIKCHCVVKVLWKQTSVSSQVLAKIGIKFRIAMYTCRWKDVSNAR